MFSYRNESFFIRIFQDEGNWSRHRKDSKSRDSQAPSTVVYLVAKPLIQSEAKGYLVVIETSI